MAQTSKVYVEFDDSENIDLRRRNLGDTDDDDVKDNWDDDDDEDDVPKPLAAAAEASKAPVGKQVKKKSAKEILAEKEAEKKRVQEELRLKLESSNRTPEEIAAEKARIRKEQEDADFEFAKDTFFSEPTASEVPSETGVIEGFEPSTPDQFDSFRKLLVDKISKYEKSEFYTIFLQNLFQDLSLNLTSEDVRRSGAMLTTLAGEKAKKEKEVAGKGKTKVKAKLGKGNIAAGKKDDSMVNYEYDEIDDIF